MQGGADDQAGGAPGRARRPARRDARIEAMQARHSDLDRATFARLRAREARRRLALDRVEFDPGAPDEDDYVLPDRSQVRRMTGRPERLGAVLQSVLGERDWDERLQSVRVFSRWEEVVGSDVARHCDPVRLVGGVLVVAASSPSWATQLQYLAPRVAVAVNSAIGSPMVERVDVTVRRRK